MYTCYQFLSKPLVLRKKKHVEQIATVSQKESAAWRLEVTHHMYSLIYTFDICKCLLYIFAIMYSLLGEGGGNSTAPCNTAIAP